ncbi:GNAT family N-acetyltransferase [Crateriforma conspicua]|uniref:GNAT family N-acetyltransferase n=1 Tax=Crateriforma conspicua TaxID=2527996 RepID=UPI00118C19C1|nr:GNAT family N-acetyltransferase [Crateriforma conspicua]QDV63250.1 hypothetical protein Mal65_23920 [Crateriforma conspicua]
MPASSTTPTFSTPANFILPFPSGPDADAIEGKLSACWCDHFDGLMHDRDAWDRMTNGTPFGQTLWLAPWWDHLAGNRHCRTLVVRDEAGKLFGALPLYHDDASPHSLHNMADGNTCTDHVSVLAAPDHTDDVIDAMAGFLADTTAGPSSRWHSIQIDGVVEGDLRMESLLRALARRGVSVHRESRMSTWFVECAESFDEYLKKFSRKHRHHHRKLLRDFDQSETLHARFAQNIDDVRSILDDLIRLHQNRWVAAGFPGSFADATSRRFIHRVAELALHQDRLSLLALCQDDQTIAASLSLIGDDERAYCYCTGADLKLSKVQPGKTLNMFMLRHAHQQGYRGVDFMRGDEQYKSRLHGQPRRVMDVRLEAPGMAGRWRHVSRLAQTSVKQTIRKTLKRPTVDVIPLAD